MKINIRKGLFGLWVVGSILFAVCIGVVSYSGIRDEFRSAYTPPTMTPSTEDWETMLPVKCIPPPPKGYTLDNNKEQRGVAGTDYSYSESDGLCWYGIAAFRRLYPEYHDLTDNDLAEQIYAKAGRPIKHFHPWQRLESTIALAIGAPLAVLALGWGLLWAFSGFRSDLSRCECSPRGVGE